MTDPDDRQTTGTTPPPPPRGDAGSRGGSRIAVGPLIMIGVGVLLLASNVGWFSFGDVFRLLAYWPIALVAVGVDMLTNGRYRLAVIATAIALALVLWSADVGGRGRWTMGSAATAAHTVAVAHALDGAPAGRVVLGLGVGPVRVDGAASPATLVSGTIRAGRGERILESSRMEASTRVVEIRSEQEPFSGFGFGGDDRSWSLSLPRGVPIALDVSSGVGPATFDLTDVDLSAITYRGGVGSSDVSLPAGSYAGSFAFGVGSSTIRIPRDVAIQIAVRSGVGSVRVPNELQRSGDVYTSRDYANASERVTLRVESGVGSITIVRR
ncbi:hypothetical protein BH23DEI1_BH23DEI1_20110 [soil metagenome]